MSQDDKPEILEDGELAEALKEAYIDPDEDGEIEISEAFITDENDTVISAADVLSNWTQQSMQAFGEKVIRQKEAAEEDAREIERLQREIPKRAMAAKTAKGSTQQTTELGQSGKYSADISMVEIVEPPYPPELLSAFLEVDETHFRCVKTKVVDSVGRDFQLIPTVTVKPDEENDKEEEKAELPEPDSGDETTPIRPDMSQSPLDGSMSQLDEQYSIAKSIKDFVTKAASSLSGSGRGTPQTTRKRIVDQEDIDIDVQRIEDFIEDANEVVGFEGVLERACMDYEAIGWGAVEVIRSYDMKVRRIAHIPAVRMKALKGWKGFVECISNDKGDGDVTQRGKYIYYQPFGSKITSKRRNPISGQYEPFDPKIDGQPSPETARWNLVDRNTGKPTTSLDQAANEVIWMPRHHTNTIYYGYTDVVPALGWLLANVHIRDYLLQFFEHNTVPRYAIVIEGAKLAEGVKKAITAYFSTHVKGKAHKTLILPIPAMRGEVKVRFERLDADANEGSFQDTKKNNAQSIMASHGVSPGIIGITEQSELGSGKGLSQAEIYKDRIVTPSQRYWARKLNYLFRRGLGTTLVALKFNPLDIRDEKAEQEVLVAYMMAGCTTINAVRKRASLGSPLPGGDRAFMMMGGSVMFVDEMTEAMGTERAELEASLQATQEAMQMQSLEHKAEGFAKNQAEEAKKVEAKDKAATKAKEKKAKST